MKNTSSHFSWTRLFIVRMLACSLYLTIWSRHASFQHALIYPIKFQGIQKAGEIGSHPVYSDPSFLIHGLGKRLVTDVCCFRKTVRRRRAIFSTFVLCCCSLISSILAGSQFSCLIMREDEGCAFPKPPLFVDSLPYHRWKIMGVQTQVSHIAAKPS